MHKSAPSPLVRQIRTYNVTNTQQQLRTTQQQLRTGLTGEAWPACRAIRPFHSNTTLQARHGQLAEQFSLFIQTPLVRRSYLYIVRTSIIAKNGHLNIVLRNCDRRGMASLQSNSTFSFKHHLTGEAWPACRAIVPFHSNTT